MIEMFLMLLKKSIENNTIQFICRTKNKEFLAKFGWTVEDIYEFLYNELTPEDFVYKDKEKDSDFDDGDMYIFIKYASIENEEIKIYIKIKYTSPDDFMVLISFHEAER
ncbi:Putative toxin [Marinitoga phage MPV1]|uniref:Uncharacterized protein n=1 Tax=Marinitoga piezophila (strain DSM 14283 / JCM 11233 / KA3) TaxID=443254 RepID=H2J439_MARPK|nr:type II toxin-antitoxin system MqsR family toxin [Marinitoga piezophila]AEX84767.1 hypothetical protein Marpi_0316 [Marinitoga piezophila KA3]